VPAWVAGAMEGFALALPWLLCRKGYALGGHVVYCVDDTAADDVAETMLLWTIGTMMLRRYYAV